MHVIKVYVNGKALNVDELVELLYIMVLSVLYTVSSERLNDHDLYVIDKLTERS